MRLPLTVIVDTEAGRAKMASTMIQLYLPKREPTLTEVAAILGIDVAALDPAFGIIATDPERGLYAVLVAPEAAERACRAIEARGVGGAEGVFSDPRISPFGKAGV